MSRDRHRLERRLRSIIGRLERGQGDPKAVAALAEAIDRSAAKRVQRAWPAPFPEPPTALPITAHLDRIATLLKENQVVVVCGETGSGKTTQLPQLCLRLGRGTAGMIGHTQPRRLAARSVAARIAEELGVEPGREVGYKVRFSDHTRPETRLKLMTDGMLLAEIQHDRYLTAYDTIIVDEAHERSLNIDFLLGYLHDLLPRRPDLRLIVTSATIDTVAIAAHFGGAPVIEVAGRGYPIEIRYRPPADDADDDGVDPYAGLVAAVDELLAEGPGDILVFLSGEREIHDAAEALRHHRHRGIEILPLYARLGAAEQQRIFHPEGRRIVLATNIAETSLTVPGIRYVIDTGLARLSRYSHRTKVQRLPVEPISQASARQRAGRCGRTGPGICIRLYGEDDLAARPAQTEPEIRRTNLASVILQMSEFGLGRIESFPFLDTPDPRFVNDGYRLLIELGALDAERRPTQIGRRLARLMVDPRHGRMLLAAAESGCLREVTIIVAALASQDPRLRPPGREQAAAERQREFCDEDSDFLGFVRLWEAIEQAFTRRSRRQRQVYCQERFLSWRRLREWRETQRQLHRVMSQMGYRENSEPADYATIHKALLTGLLGHVGLHKEEGEYLGARGLRWRVFPGSALARRRPRWLVAALLQETSRLYGHTVARVEPEWVEAVAPEYLLRRHRFEPHWEKRRGQVVAYEQVSLYGLQLCGRRRVAYARIDRDESRRLFLQALAGGEVDERRLPFVRHNLDLLAELEVIEDKLRRRDYVIDTERLAACYDERLPAGIVDMRGLERWWRRADDEERDRLRLTADEVRRDGEVEVDARGFPDHHVDGGLRLPLRYHFAPGEDDDGVTLRVPLAVLDRIDADRLEWLVPGLLADKVLALIRALPKHWRRRFIPAQSFASACAEAMRWGEGRLGPAIAAELERMTGVAVPDELWSSVNLPSHLLMRIEVIDDEGEVIACGRDLDALRHEIVPGEGASPAGRAVVIMAEGDEEPVIEDWDDIPSGRIEERVMRERHGLVLEDHPALVCHGRKVRLCRLGDADEACRAHRRGICRLLTKSLATELRSIWQGLPGRSRWGLGYARIGSVAELEDHWAMAVCREAMAGLEAPRTRAEWEDCRARVAERLAPIAADYGRLLTIVVELHGRIRKRTKTLSGPCYLRALSDIQGQLALLLEHGFIASVPVARLHDYERYLEAVLLRLERLEQDPGKDRERQLTVAPLWERCRQRWRGIGQAAGDEIYWLMEELRISVFAQPMRTAQKVSPKRIAALLS